MPKSKAKIVALLSEKPLDDDPIAGKKVARKHPLLSPSDKGPGSMAYSDRELGPIFAQTMEKKGNLSRSKWANTAYVLVARAQKAAQTYGKKDFNSLYRLVLSAGIAFDKAFPQQVQPISGNLVVQLFGSLAPETAKRILEPVHPTIIDITPKVEPLGIDGGESIDEPTLNDKPLDETT